MSLAATIRTEFNDEAYRADLASVVGPRSVEGLAAWIDELCRVQLAERVAGARFACKSVGAVFGLVLTDGRGVVLKLFPEHGAPPRPDDYRALLRETAATPLISWG
jgi:hypothetical protein